MDLVSVIVPYFKKKQFIRQTVESILSQTYDKFEILIIDDENSNISKNLLIKISKLDKRITILTNKRNLGVGKSRNKGISKSKGIFVAFCDSDDLWDKNKLNYQILKMKRLKLDISSTDYKIIDEKNNFMGKRENPRNIKFKNLLNSCDVGLSTVIIRRSLFDNLKYRFPNLKTKEDYVLWLKITKDKVIIKNFNKKLTSWRNCNNSLSSSTFQKLLDGYRVYRYYLNYGFIHSIIRLIILSINYLKKKI